MPDGQYVGSPVGMSFKLFLSIILGCSFSVDMSMDPQSVCLAL
jgi:hypothetical protein